jgi:hypothetical protein
MAREILAWRFAAGAVEPERFAPAPSSGGRIVASSR